ncbi:hypothetical protein LUZ60_013091 [Juncus effusus]|nr:hypothetical protein LUZ60_013091 [Juncus effusus]
MASFKLILSLLLIATTFSSISARSAPRNLNERLQSNSLMQCWDSLMELRSCTGEVILFFINGQTYLGQSCCRAIGVIQSQCWAADAMLAAMGFTAEEGDVLRGYCDASNNDDVSPSSPNPPTAPSPALG